LDGELPPADGAESQLRAQSLLPGTTAPNFGMPDLEGAHRQLLDWGDKPAVIAFLDPECEACTRLVPMLADALADEPGIEPEPVVVVLGTAEAATALTADIRGRCTVLVDPERQLGASYSVAATPSAYWVDAQGVIDRPIALGGEEILRMLTLPEGLFAGTDPAKPVNGQPTRLRPITESRINRAGLEPGAQAPDFDLPRVGGGRLALQDFRGRRLLLVFSDPECEPCEDLAPHLQDIHKREDIAVAVISRGEMDVNARKQADLRLTYPVGLQHHWRTSRDYATFATPAGYLIDERGEISSPVALGRDRILALVGSTPAQTIEGSVK
jgi:peroxiredoxin